MRQATTLTDGLIRGDLVVSLDDIEPELANLPMVGTVLTNTVVIESDQGMAVSEETTAVDGSVGLDLAPPKPGSAGQVNRFDVIGGTPGKKVYYVYGLQGGTTAVPGCTGKVVDINGATVFGEGLSDVTGASSTAASIPLKAQGMTVLFQSVELATCSVSNRIDHVFQ